MHYWRVESQGCPVERALEKARRIGAGSMIGETEVQTLAFAYDVVLFASSRGGLQDSTDAFLREMSFMCLMCQRKKMCLIITSGRYREEAARLCPSGIPRHLRREGSRINHCSKYKYLGVKVGANGVGGTKYPRAC